MIKVDEARAIASEHNYENTIRAAARNGHFHTKLIFCSESLAMSARKALMDNGFICGKIDSRYTREGTDFMFDAKWV